VQNNKVFMSGGLDKRIYVWNIPRKRIAFQVDIGDMITAGAFVSDKGEYLVVGTDTGKLLFCETEVRPVSSLTGRTTTKSLPMLSAVLPH
jgi:WD40 repeat protein